MPAGGVVLREAAASDLEAMYRLDLLCFEEAFQFDRSAMRRFAFAAGAVALVACVAGSLAGFVIVNLRGGTGYLTTVDVHPQYRRTGLGGRLLAEAEARAQVAGAVKMRLHVWAENGAAQRFYERAGYERSRRVRGYYGAGLDAWEWDKELLSPGEVLDWRVEG